MLVRKEYCAVGMALPIVFDFIDKRTGYTKYALIPTVHVIYCSYKSSVMSGL